MLNMRRPFWAKAWKLHPLILNTTIFIRLCPFDKGWNIINWIWVWTVMMQLISTPCSQGLRESISKLNFCYHLLTLKLLQIWLFFQRNIFWRMVVYTMKIKGIVHQNNINKMDGCVYYKHVAFHFTRGWLICGLLWCFYQLYKLLTLTLNKMSSFMFYRSKNHFSLLFGIWSTGPGVQTSELVNHCQVIYTAKISFDIIMR